MAAPMNAQMIAHMTSLKADYSATPMADQRVAQKAALKKRQMISQ
jgi:hypothetical protein